MSSASTDATPYGSVDGSAMEIWLSGLALSQVTTSEEAVLWTLYPADIKRPLPDQLKWCRRVTNNMRRLT